MALVAGVADDEDGGRGLHASSTFSSAPRLASSSRRKPSISSPCVERVVLCSLLLPEKSISNCPSVHVKTLKTASSPRSLPKTAWLICPSMKYRSQRSFLLARERRQFLCPSSSD